MFLHHFSLLVFWLWNDCTFEARVLNTSVILASCQWKYRKKSKYSTLLKESYQQMNLPIRPYCSGTPLVTTQSYDLLLGFLWQALPSGASQISRLFQMIVSSLSPVNYYWKHIFQWNSRKPAWAEHPFAAAELQKWGQAIQKIFQGWWYLNQTVCSKIYVISTRNCCPIHIYWTPSKILQKETTISLQLDKCLCNMKLWSSEFPDTT